MDWKDAVDLGSTWAWQQDKLWHTDAIDDPAAKHDPTQTGTSLRSKFVNFVYADQNRSPAVRNTLRSLVAALPDDGVGLNIGAGHTRYAGVVNLEISDGPEIDIIGRGSVLPFRDNSVDLVITQEVLEHVADYLELVQEIHRVLKPGGLFFCQVPFQIGFHPGPCDYWRFTKQGLEHMFQPPTWERQQLTISLGHGSGFYRIAVEFAAVTASCLWSKLYIPTKAAAALGLYPIKLLDLVTDRSLEKDRIPGGYFCVAMKPKPQ